ncbi:MAG TPA: hypothetical protein VL361_18305 [Candidatus Limnocylindrales bacterium]|jgi:hypothetical protein|nr:hypothetical protein [Candidatus Limnocylindrales bacterium]
MRKSSARVPTSKSDLTTRLPDLPDLEFPVAPDFVSRLRHLEAQVIMRRCAKNMPWRSMLPGTKERRSAQKIPVEFVL